MLLREGYLLRHKTIENSKGHSTAVTLNEVGRGARKAALP